MNEQQAWEEFKSYDPEYARSDNARVLFRAGYNAGHEQGWEDAHDAEGQNA